MSQLPQYLEVCESAARAGGVELRQWLHRTSSREKGPRDLVTEADFASQKAIRAAVLSAYPEHGFLGEEDSADSAEPLGHDYLWVVDPLDGTVNYVHGLRPYAVSVALVHRKEVLVGVVYDPTHDECFSAQRGAGARLNGQPLHVSGCRELDRAMVAASLPANVERDSGEICRFIDVLVACQSLRRLGSAALNLCYVAAGQLDAYWTTSAKCWDVAAGALIASEAGGSVSALDGGPLTLEDPRLLAAATPELRAALMATVGE